LVKTFLLAIFYTISAVAGPPSPFDHLRGSDEIDFFTRMPVTSELSKVNQVLVRLKMGELTLKTANSELEPLGVLVEREDNRHHSERLEIAGTKLWSIGQFIFPSHVPYILRIEGSLVRANLMDALVKELPLRDLMADLNISRIIITNGTDVRRFELALGQLIEREKKDGVLVETDVIPGFIRIEPRSMYSILHSYGYYFFPSTWTEEIYRHLFTHFWESLSKNLQPENYESVLETRLAMLGFQNSHLIMSKYRKLGTFMQLKLLAMYAAMGFRFSMKASN